MPGHWPGEGSSLVAWAVSYEPPRSCGTSVPAECHEKGDPQIAHLVRSRHRHRGHRCDRASYVGVGKRNRWQADQHQDRRPAGLAAARRRLEIAGPSEFPAAASLSVMTASGSGDAPKRREAERGVTAEDSHAPPRLRRHRALRALRMGMGKTACKPCAYHMNQW
jgi:hypothetical protein